MSDVAQRDENRVPVLLVFTATGEVIQVYGDDTTHRLLVQTQADAVASLGDGSKVVTTAGTRVALASSTASREVTITALYSNTDMVVIGGATVVAEDATRRGVPLTPGQSITLRIDDLAKIYIDSVVSGEGVSFIYAV